MDQFEIGSIPALLRDLATDVALTGLQFVVGIYDSRNATWLGQEPSKGTSELEAPEGFEGMVVVLPGRQQEVSSDRSGDAPHHMHVVDAVCDWVMDESGHGWPELADAQGSFLALLTPQSKQGRVVWTGGGQEVPIGQLSSALIVPLNQ